MILLASATVGQLLGLAAMMTLGTVLTVLWPVIGYPVLGLSLLALVSWLTVIHSLFLGFTMSMVMAHAPVIIPAVLRCRLPITG